jgi:hypothetical protein
MVDFFSAERDESSPQLVERLGLVRHVVAGQQQHPGEDMTSRRVKATDI